MNKIDDSQNQDPISGIFINGKEIINDGKMISSGKRPVIAIQTDKYSGKGITETKQTVNIEEELYQKWWFKFILTIIGGLFIGYLIFKFGWNK